MNDLQEKMQKARQDNEYQTQQKINSSLKEKEYEEWLYSKIQTILQDFVDGDENLELVQNPPKYTISYYKTNSIDIEGSIFFDRAIVRNLSVPLGTWQTIYDGDLDEKNLRDKLGEFLLSWYKALPIVH